MSKIQVAWDAPDPSCDIAGNCWAGSLPYSVRWTGLGGGWHTLSASGGYICPWGAPCPGYALQTTGLTTQIGGGTGSPVDASTYGSILCVASS